MSQWRKYKKVELHRHLEGAISLSTVLEVAGEAGIKLPASTIEELRPIAIVSKPMGNLKEVLDKLMYFQSVMATPKILERISYEACIDAFNEGIRVLELRYSPSFINLNHPKLNYDIIHEGIKKGVLRAEKELNGKLAVGLICIFTREMPASEAEKTTAFVINHKDSFVGFDLAGDEAGFDSRLFTKMFDRVRNAGIRITVHSGEDRLPEAAQFVKNSIELLHAERIGHGVQIINDPKIMDFVSQKGVVLEVCPTSNVLTHAVDTIKVHPIRKLMDAGIKVTLNSDDPGLYGMDLTFEYDTLSRELGFTKEDFNKLNDEAIKASFIRKEKVQAAWQIQN